MRDLILLFQGLEQEKSQFIISCILLAMCYSSYWFLSHEEKFLNLLSKSEKGSWLRVSIIRITGFIFMGAIPLLIITWSGNIPLSETGIGFSWDPIAWQWLLVLTPLIIVINLFSSRKQSNLKQYPQIRETHWTIKTFVVEYAGWAIYLLGYEYLFRGIFLFGAATLIGNAPAIALNASVYSLAHIPKGWEETLGALILGFFISYITLLTGTIWCALVLHILIAWSNSIFSFLAHPDIKYDSGK